MNIPRKENTQWESRLLGIWCDKNGDPLSLGSKTNKTVYIAGKITGDPNYQDKFLDAEQHLTNKGYIPLSPAILPIEGFSYGAYLRMSAAMLRECDFIYLLPDWQDSEGAKAEYNLAKQLGIEVLEG